MQRRSAPLAWYSARWALKAALSQLFLPLSPNNNLTAARRKQAPAAPCTTLSDTITSSCALRGNRKKNGVNVACERFSRRRELKRKAFACGTCGGSRIEGAMCGKLIY